MLANQTLGCCGTIRKVLNGGEIAVSELMQPKAEAEIAFVLGKDLTAENLTSVDIISAVDYALASIEIVGSRIKNLGYKNNRYHC